MDKALASEASNLGSIPSGDILHFFAYPEVNMADIQSLQEELANLRKEINYHNYLYNTLDQPAISDFEYDQLFNRLKEIEAQHPELITPDSPSQRVGSKLSEKFPKVQHPAPILSLANGFGPEATMDWYERIAKIDPRVKTAKFVL